LWLDEMCIDFVFWFFWSLKSDSRLVDVHTVVNPSYKNINLETSANEFFLIIITYRQPFLTSFVPSRDLLIIYDLKSSVFTR